MTIQAPESFAGGMRDAWIFLDSRSTREKPARRKMANGTGQPIPRS